MWLAWILAVAIATVQGQYVLESLSFGHGSNISPNKFGIPGWHISGEGHTPQLLSDKVILTPPYPGSRRGAIWADNEVSHPEWTADFEFRAGGTERGGGNLQIWYTKEGQAHVGTSSIYTVGKFDGLVLVVDTYGGRGGGIRGFLNDGNTEYKNHHSVDSLAFGHCDYSYRNLGRPSRIQIKQQRDFFEVAVDGRSCFKSDKIKLPPDYYFGISAASAETPDSFEIYKFILSTTTSYAREEPRRDTPPQVQQAVAAAQNHDTPASSIKSTEAQFADLHSRLVTMSHAIDNLFQHLATHSANTETSYHELTRKMTSTEQLGGMDARLQAIERTVQAIQKDVEGKDYHGQLAKLQDTLHDSHSSLLESLPHAMNQSTNHPILYQDKIMVPDLSRFASANGVIVVSTTKPRMGFFIFVVIVFQLLLAGSYVVYKRRRANAPKKYL
ncbi:hypothetical protein MMC16_001644 [Acarospora aff. strigata]|nr:hypothetical protein [Acarospora aff. strigata]